MLSTEPSRVNDILPSLPDLLARASTIAAAYDREAAALSERAALFTHRLATMNAARVGEKRARGDVVCAEEQLVRATAAQRAAETACARAEKELSESIRGV